MRKSFKIILISLSFILVVLGLVYFFKRESKAIVRIDSTTLRVDKFNICRNIINPTAQSFMIPVGSQAEWCSFIQNASSLGIIVEKCQICRKRCNCCNCSTL